MASAVAAQAGSAQQAGPSKRLVMLVSAAAGRASFAQMDGSVVPVSEIIREIDDPRNGDRWLLVGDARHPAGPGLLLRVTDSRGESAHLVAAGQTGPVAQPTANARTASGPESGPEPGLENQAPVPIVRVGDRVIVEEHTAMIEARLEAVAMGPALPDSPFNARLSIGGRVVRVVAKAPGRAVFQELTQP
jgi:hypothetical protein